MAAALTIYLIDASPPGSSEGGLQIGGSAPSVLVTATGCTVDSTITTPAYSSVVFNTIRASSTFGATVLPTATGPAAKDCWAATTPLTGNFASGTWTIAIGLNSSATATVTVNGRFRLWACSDPITGSNPVQLTTAAVALSSAAWSASSGQLNTTATVSLGAISLNNQYLYFQMAFEDDTVSSASTNITFVQDPANSVITTPLFTPANTSFPQPIVWPAMPVPPQPQLELYTGGKLPVANANRIAQAPRADAITPVSPGLLTGASLPEAGILLGPMGVGRREKIAPASVQGQSDNLYVHNVWPPDMLLPPLSKILAGVAGVTGIQFAALRADPMTPVFPGLLTGATLPASGSLLFGAAPRADAMMPVFPELFAGASGAGKLLFSAAPRADAMTPVFPELLTGSTLPASGSLIFGAAPRADAMTPVFPDLLTGYTLSEAGILLGPMGVGRREKIPAASVQGQSDNLYIHNVWPPDMPLPQPGAILPGVLGVLASPFPAPRADAIQPVFPELLVGDTLPASGSLIFGTAPRADAMTPVFPELLAGYALPAAGTLLFGAAPRADLIPNVTPALLVGAAGAGVLRFAAPRADAIQPVFPELIAGATLPASGSQLFGAAPRADPMTPVFPELLTGYVLPAAGSLLFGAAPRADAIPLVFPELLTGHTLPASGSLIFGAAPRADAMTPVFPELLTGSTLPASGSLLFGAAPRADAIPTIFPELLAGYVLPAAGSLLETRAEPVPPVFPELLAGYVAPVLGTILSVRAEPIPTATSELLEGYVLPAAGTLLFARVTAQPKTALLALYPGSKTKPTPPVPPTPAPVRKLPSTQGGPAGACAPKRRFVVRRKTEKELAQEARRREGAEEIPDAEQAPEAPELPPSVAYVLPELPESVFHVVFAPPEVSDAAPTPTEAPSTSPDAATAPSQVPPPAPPEPPATSSGGWLAAVLALGAAAAGAVLLRKPARRSNPTELPELPSLPKRGPTRTKRPGDKTSATYEEILSLHSLPPNAVIQEKMIRCQKPACLSCPHGPYLYASWWQDGQKITKYLGRKLQ